MKNMAMTDYISCNDLLGAYERYETTSRQWKNRWWETVEKIFHSCEKWAKRFILDPIKRTLTRIQEKKKRGRPAKYEADLDFECEVDGCGTYFVEHYSNGKKVWGKCGKADNGKVRLAQHFRVDYPGEIDYGVVKLWYPCVNSDHALTMENVMRDYFNRVKRLALLGKDRFPKFEELTADDVAYLNHKYEMTKALFA